jgi:hypothetical protein
MQNVHYCSTILTNFMKGYPVILVTCRAQTEFMNVKKHQKCQPLCLSTMSSQYWMEMTKDSTPFTLEGQWEICMAIKGDTISQLHTRD